MIKLLNTLFCNIFKIFNNFKPGDCVAYNSGLYQEVEVMKITKIEKSWLYDVFYLRHYEEEREFTWHSYPDSTDYLRKVKVSQPKALFKLGDYVTVDKLRWNKLYPYDSIDKTNVLQINNSIQLMYNSEEKSSFFIYRIIIETQNPRHIKVLNVPEWFLTFYEDPWTIWKRLNK